MKANKSKHRVRGPPLKSLSRKEKRKAERKLKKARKCAFAEKNYDLVEKMKDLDTYRKIQRDEKKKEKDKEKKLKAKSEKKEKTNVAQERLQEMQQRELEEQNMPEKEILNEDEIEIRKWEKKLKLNKRKVKSKLPQSFIDEGWDYILDATESDKIKDFDDLGGPIEEDSEASEEENFDESADSDTEIKSNWDPDSQAGKSILKKKKVKKEKKKKSVKFSLQQDGDDGDSDNDASMGSDDFFAGEDEDDLDLKDDEEEDDDDDDQMDFEDFGGSDVSDSDEDQNDLSDEGDTKEKGEEGPSGNEKTEEEPELKEDIYGRLRDKDGNVVSSAYIPPAKRAMMAGGQPNEALHKSLKGLVNKISEATMQFMTNKVESLYLDNSRAAVNETLCALIIEAVVMPALAPERLVAEIAMLLAILHGNVGSEVGAFFLQKLAVKFQALFDVPNYGVGKKADNILMLLCNLYNFQIVSAAFITDIIHKLVGRFNARDIELLLLLFKTIGFTLRKDDPAQLKIIILDIQMKAREVEVATSGEAGENRVKFMLEILTAIRNNNMRMIPGYDPSHLAHLKKVAKSFLRGQALGDNKLTIGLEDLLKADSSGKWWIVGSAWDGRKAKGDSQKESASKTATTIELSGMNKKLLKLAKKQGMNTDVRRHIFCVIGTSEDFEDAFSRLLCLGLNKTQEREIIHVVFHCCVNEKTYNPFYAFLMEKFSAFDRRFMITVLHTMWDKFKEVNSMTKESRIKLGHLLSHLLLSKALSLSVFKAVEFGMESKKMIRLMVQVLTEILSTHNLGTLTEIFQRVAPLPNLKALRTGLQVFMRVHLNGVAGKGLSSTEMQERIDKAEASMFSHQSTLM